jgi:hypothetical protein
MRDLLNKENAAVIIEKFLPIYVSLHCTRERATAFRELLKRKRFVKHFSELVLAGDTGTPPDPYTLRQKSGFLNQDLSSRRSILGKLQALLPEYPDSTR